MYADFFGVTSLEDVASRIAREVVRLTPLYEKLAKAVGSIRPGVNVGPNGVSVTFDTTAGLSGIDLLVNYLETLKRFVQTQKKLFHVVFDEFQEIADLPGATKIEGILRHHIQQIRASFVFVGSRRRMLLDMFNEKHRPFYASAINVELAALPRTEFADFIAQQFSEAGKLCSQDLALCMIDRVRCYPYYTQKFAYFVYNRCGRKVTKQDMDDGLSDLVTAEKPVFESILMGLAPSQIALLKALATEPTKQILAHSYLSRQRLKSIGGVQGARKKLVKLDLIEQDENMMWRVVDPVLTLWLKSN